MVTRALEGGEQAAVYRVSGAFDREAAWALRDAVVRESAHAIHIDFGSAVEVSELGLAVLANALLAQGHTVRMAGLKQRQLRVFRYCGLPFEELSAMAA